MIAQVNKEMPRTWGDTCLHVSEIDSFVEIDHPVLELSLPYIGDVEKAIGENCAKLIKDGDTLQPGIGAIPDAVLLFLKDKKDLGIHSETFTEAMMELIQAGVITNKCKTLHPSKCVFAQLAGSVDLYKFADGNPMFETYPVDYVNDPMVICQNFKQTSINACLQVDLKGQVNSETVKGKQFSGIGGQLDHVRGAQMSKGGKSIIALKSTAKGDTISQIVPFMEPGNVVTVSRYDSQYIVTEYGIADLKHKTERERAAALIAIAHPKFREELTQKAFEMGLLH